MKNRQWKKRLAQIEKRQSEIQVGQLTECGGTDKQDNRDRGSLSDGIQISRTNSEHFHNNQPSDIEARRNTEIREGRVQNDEPIRTGCSFNSVISTTS